MTDQEMNDKLASVTKAINEAQGELVQALNASGLKPTPSIVSAMLVNAVGSLLTQFHMPPALVLALVMDTISEITSPESNEIVMPASKLMH